MSTHDKPLYTALTAIDAQMNVDIVGQRMSGRSTLAKRVASHFESIGWVVMEVPGRPMLRNAPLAAAGLAGLGETSAFRVAEEVTKRAKGQSAIIVVDDWDYLDHETWAALAHVHQQIEVPLLTTRGIDRRAAGPFAIPGLRMARTVDVPELDVPALRELIKSVFAITLDPAALVHLAALSGGAVGVASALVSAALEEDLLDVRGDKASLTGDLLWTRSAFTAVEAILVPLSESERHALEVLSALGPTRVTDAAKHVSREDLTRLADLDLIRVEPGSSSVSIRSALVDEYFRHQQDTLRFALMEGLGGAPRPAPGPSTTSGAATLSSAYLHSARALDMAQQEYQESPTIGTAADLVETMGMTLTRRGQLADLFAESSELEGSDEDVIRWDQLYLFYGLFESGDPEPALERLHEHSMRIPSAEALYVAAETLVGIVTGKTADIDKLPTRLEGAMEGTADVVNHVRFYGLLSAGRFAEARSMVGAFGEEALASIDHFVMVSLLECAEGDFEGVANRASARFFAARDEKRWGDLAPLAYLCGFASFILRGHNGAHQVLTEFHHLGAPCHEPFIWQGVANGWSSVRLGAGHSIPAEFQIPQAGLPYESPLPGMHPDWQRALDLAAAGRKAEGSKVAAALAESHWEKGFRFSSLCAYMLAGTLHPNASLLDALHERVIPHGTPTISWIGEMIAHVSAGDLEAAETFLGGLVPHGKQVGVAYAWEWMSRQWEAVGDTVRAEGALKRGENAAEARADITRLSGGIPKWTPRESELIRYLIAGYTYPAIARRLSLSQRTVEGIGRRAMKRAGVSTRADLLRVAGVG